MTVIDELATMETEYQATDKRDRAALEAFATRWCLPVAECGAWSEAQDAPVDMKRLTMPELQWTVDIEMDVYVDRMADAFHSRF